MWSKSTLTHQTLVATILIAFSSTARAEAPPPGGTAANALFYQARTLMKDGRYREACLRFEESLKLEYGVGTDFNLADCNEKLGKVATALSGFQRVADAARKQNQPEREQLARQRARALEPRVPRLVLDVPSGGAARLEITRDGVSVDAASWGVPQPVDPGPHHVTATASGRAAWETVVNASEGARVVVTIPRELTEPAAAIAETTPTTIAPPVTEERHALLRPAGWALGTLGLVSLGIGTGFAIDSVDRGARSKASCRGDLCNARGLELRSDAIRSGNVATVTMIGGAAALVAGVVLVLTAPTDSRRVEQPTTGWRAVPHIAQSGAGLTLEGVLR